MWPSPPAPLPLGEGWRGSDGACPERACGELVEAVEGEGMHQPNETLQQ